MRSALLLVSLVSLSAISARAATLALKDGSSLSGEIVAVEWDYYSVRQAANAGAVQRIIPRSDVVKIDAQTDRERELLAKPEPDFETSAEQNTNELPPERTLAVNALQKWYGAALDLKGDAALAKAVLRAETLVLAYLRATDASKRKAWLDELMGLKLDPRIVRAVVQEGPTVLGAELKTGRFRMRSVVPAIAGGFVNFSAYVPESYTSKKRWPVIVILHGTMLNGDQYLNYWMNNEPAAGYILLAPWANHAHGFGPSALGRGQVFAALDWAAAHYRIDTERVFIAGVSMGGAGAKRLAIVQPDRFACACSDSGAPLEPTLEVQYRNLHALPVYSWSGAQDQLVPNRVILHEKEITEGLKLPFTYTIDPQGGHATNPNLAAEAVHFFEDKKRARYPERLDFASQEDGSGLRHYYVEITRADEPANVSYTFNVLNIMKMVDYSNGDLEKARDLKGLVEKGGDIIVDTRRMWRKAREVELHLDRVKNTIVIDKAALVRTLRVYVDDEMLDLDQDVKVVYNNRPVATQKVTRSIAFMLDEARQRGRRDLTYWGVIEVKLAP